MKKLNYLLISLVLLTNLYPQDPIKDYSGIPILTYLGDNFRWHTNPFLYKQMDSVGIFGTEVGNMKDDYYPFIEDANLKVLPNQIDGVDYNYINRYTDAYYSVWEAEGTNPANGDATLYYKSSVGEPVTGAIRTKINQGIANDTLIYGPYYMQEVKYVMVQNDVRIPYRVEFRLKKETIGMPPNPNDIICVLQATTSHVTDTWPFHIDTTKVLDSLIVRYSELADTFKTFNLNYNYFNVDTLFTTDTTKFRAFSNYIQFKVLWKGNSNKVRLYVDKIILSDQRGRDIFDPYLSPSVEQLIASQISADFSASYNNRVIGWLGIDEPLCIDQFEPIRVVQNIVDTYGQGKELWIATGTNYNGRFDGNVPVGEINPFGSYKLKTFDEFYKRVGKANLWSDYYLYVNDDGTYGSDFKEKRIMYMVDTVWSQYKNKENVFWGASVPTGYYGDSSTSWIGMREIDSKDFLYNVNIALLCGAKVLSLWTYFANIDIGFTLKRTALVNAYWLPPRVASSSPSYFDYTDKWATLRDTIAPRLSGLMGITLKSIKPAEHYLNINPSSYGDQNLNLIKKVKLDYGNQTEAMNSFIDLGFFNKQGFEPNRYFMIINRYYSDTVLNKFKIDFRNLSGVYNWSFMNYVDSSNTTIIANEAGFVTSPQFQINSGDAILFSLFPVVEFGGKLLVSDGVGDGMTLSDDMTIESGATLSVYETYYAKANIIVKAGGRIDNYENGKIIFDPGKQLIIEGTAQISGTAVNRLSLEFSTETLEGIVVKPNAALYINYCDVKNAKTAISAEPGSGQINISNVNFTNFSKAGIVLLGYQGDGPITPPPPIIFNCNFFGSPVGVSVSNYNEILIQANTFNNCNITIASVPSAYLQGNSLNGGSSKIFAGIFMDNSGGYIRCNSITNFLSGIHLGNSSPDIGDNTIHHNLYHGLYISTGSIPNLFARLISGQPYTYYGASGYNRIYENGMGYDPSNLLDNDGSEIYFSLSSALLGTVKRPGCNLIADDRQSTPTMSTLLLMNGTLNGDQQLYAQNNVWGTTTPTTNRFGNLSVVFSPYYSEPCLLPEGSGGSTELVTKTSTGIVVDTLYPAEGLPEDVSALEASYSLADKHILSGEVEQAKPIYEQIVQGNYTSEEKLPAYNKLYTIANLTGADETYFNNLQSTFNNIANTETDTLLKKIYNQNAIKCDVSKQEYLTAISKFDNIIQQNPNSEEAVYAEIDIITTALNLDTTNSQLGKMGGGKYLVKGTSDYLTKLNNILQNKFGINNGEKEQIIPKEYSLYQNYPNPFNPTTTIKFDIPKDGLITLAIYDILGRRISTLIEEFRTAGSYEQVFNASSLASGVYINKLLAGDFVSSKKTLLLK